MEELEAEISAIAFESSDGVRDPLRVLAELAERALATERALAARVNELARGGRLRYRTSQGVEQLRAEVALWERWHRQAARLVDRLAHYGFFERKVALEEQEAALIVSIIRGILDDLHLTPEQETIATEVVPLRLAAADQTG
jgi:hypothetical protein